MPLQQINYHRPIATRRSVGYWVFHVATCFCLACGLIAVIGQFDHFGTGFWVFNLPGGVDYFAYAPVSGGPWIFWHDIAIVSAILPTVWCFRVFKHLSRSVSGAAA